MKKSNSTLVALAILGLLVGGFVAFLARPLVLYIGQLPFEVVITRGMFLKEFGSSSSYVRSIRIF